ncbi:hypothetical protein [Dyadobacter sp. 32]|uniref:hypothetical protein n=1 Tax=Dyadobacter sp. 32 TaxID=538966 RepID=UPI0011ED710D
MKTSNKLLTGLLAIILLFGFTSNMVLKGEFDKIDRNNPFAGYRKEALKSFRYIHVEGKVLGYTQIQPGKDFEIQTAVAPEEIEWRIQNDTLRVRYKNDVGKNYPPDYNFERAPITYIRASTLYGIKSVSTACKVRDWTLDSLSLYQQGQDMQVEQNKVDTLTVNLEKQASFRILKNNKVNSASVIVRDNSDFVTEDVYKTLSITADSTTRVNLPGNLLKQAKSL